MTYSKMPIQEKVAELERRVMELERKLKLVSVPEKEGKRLALVWRRLGVDELNRLILERMETQWKERLQEINLAGFRWK